MSERWVDDGGNNTTGLSWATAYTSIQALVAAEPTFITTAGNVVYFGHDSNCTAAGSALTVAGPSGSDPVLFISLSQGGTAYQKGTGNQINTVGGNYTVTLDGSIAMYGIKVASGGTGAGSISLATSTPRVPTLSDCTLAPGANGSISLGGNATRLIARDLTVDLTADGTTNRSNTIIASVTGYLDLIGLTIVNPGYRTGTVIKSSTSCVGMNVSGVDFSGFQTATPVSGAAESSCVASFTNCITASPTQRRSPMRHITTGIQQIITRMTNNRNTKFHNIS